ncbi:MAG: DUF222 domain-containing protein [Chloroflexi bacterium]|nr:MAG: DUF222 domain-containing protein [Chloroflexota bacterium]
MRAREPLDYEHMYELAELPDSALGEELISLRREIDAREAEFAAKLAVFERHKGYLAYGCLSLLAWLRWHCRMRLSSGKTRLEMARQLEQLPSTARALAEGQITFDNARVITRTAAAVGAERMGPGEPILLEAAKELDPGLLSVAAAHLRHSIDPEGSLKDLNDAHDRRGIWLSQTFGGVFVFDGRLDPEGGAYLQTALNALLGPRSAGDPRDPAERRADALVELARQALNRRKLPQVAGQKPHLSLIVRNETLEGAPGAEAADLEWAGAVPGETALRIACDCSLTEISVDKGGTPVGVGRTRRTISARLRKALVARDRHCRFPGCDMPVDWTDGHHRWHWVLGGPTVLWNLTLLCSRHHRLVHEGGWRLLDGENGELAAAPP